jgi:hypothetical protein
MWFQQFCIIDFKGRFDIRARNVAWGNREQPWRTQIFHRLHNAKLEKDVNYDARGIWHGEIKHYFHGNIDVTKTSQITDLGCC